ncbi:MAG: hypothetical protein D6756_11555 [Cyanobacteria bacterium J083]|nr:MAG: hypothetical protein D6756_11555 [Cyanobacteria bacterium J083]
MKLLYKLIWLVTHPYNRAEIYGNLTVAGLAFVYVVLSFTASNSASQNNRLEFTQSQSSGVEIFHLKRQAVV